ncbi:Nif3-like dinuclear metal center hexameric protein [Algoriphagus kandeliae]|uniref:Nif3-like dinuclear metal center hexameric protein n=1 Tax=Algoriphagus kandeliae TaxID=2562278 RepID=UPI001F224F44|nr:Nif3-like dinuclear metal center hexameric protein [Algoriphagus kandeliae]
MKKSRRSFLTQSGLLLGAGLTINPIWSFAQPEQREITVGGIMDAFIAQVSGAPFPQTVDTLKVGSRDQIVTGVVTTMFATMEVIQRAIALKANFIIPHEPTFFNHLDETDWLEKDKVFQAKYDLMEENGIALWRNHDYIHRLADDGVRLGVVKDLDWMAYYQANSPVLNIPQTNLASLIQHIKSKLDVPAMRYVGDLDQPCEKVLLIPGAAGGRAQIEGIMKYNPDVLICGESNEWETPEYVRAANSQGKKLSLIVIGHSASEEGGSEFLKSWLESQFPGLPVFHVPSGNSLKII